MPKEDFQHFFTTITEELILEEYKNLEYDINDRTTDPDGTP